MKVTKLNFFYKGKRILEGKRVEENGIIETKYLNHLSDRYVKFSTKTFKNMGLSEEVIDKVRVYYFSTPDLEVVEAHQEVNILLDYTPAVALANNDEFVYRKNINSHFYYQVIKKAEYWPTVRISSADTAYEDIDSQLAKIGYELMEKHFHVVLEAYRKRINEAVRAASAIVEEFNVKATIEAKTPTQKEPSLPNIMIGIPKELLTKAKSRFPQYTGQIGFKNHINFCDIEDINMMYAEMQISKKNKKDEE